MRKIKRQGGSATSIHGDIKAGQGRNGKGRAARRTGASIREKLVASNINIPAPSIHSIQEKISSAVSRGSKQIQKSRSSRKSSALPGSFSPGNSRHHSENPRSGSIYEATPRTETQRKTSGDRVFRPMKNQRVYDAHSEVVPPVMVRGGMGGMTFGRAASSRMQKRKSPRRRIDVPLNIPGAEVRLPSIPMVHLGWRAISLLMVVMMAASLILIWKAPVFQVNAIEAEGLQRLTAGDLNAVLATFGKSVFSLDPKGLEEALQQAFPELSSASVKVGLPSSVKVVVAEREPVIAWSQDGTEFWLDAEGVSFPPRGNPANPLVRVEGHGDLPILDSDTSPGTAQNMAAEMPSGVSPTFQSIKQSTNLVSSILVLGTKMPPDTLLVYDSEHGLGWNDPNGWEVFFGAEDEDIDMKLSVYQTLVEHLQSEGIQPALISVEYVHAPYYRMER